MNDRESGPAPRFVVVGNPQSKRIELFQAALSRLGQAPARVVPYGDLLAGRVALPDVVRRDTVLRIESPDWDFETERALLALGADVADEDGDYARATRREIEGLAFDAGAILFPRQWYLGYRELLRRLRRQLDQCPAHRSMSDPDEIAVMFDKPRCHALFAAHAIPTPRGLGPVRSYDELLARMRASGCHRVFVKLAHGSSASGVVAYQVGGDRHQAMTTVEMTPAAGGVRLYNTRRLRVYRDQRDIAALIDELCRHRVHVEQWLPKAGFQNRTFDLRVVVIGGEAQHVVVRLSRHAMTNLHLGTGPTSGRTTLEALLTRLDRAVWEDARRTCERAMALFPGSLYAGIDLLIASDYRRHAVAEVNAFGDLLYGASHNGRDPYTAEVEAALRRPPAEP